MTTNEFNELRDSYKGTPIDFDLQGSSLIVYVSNYLVLPDHRKITGNQLTTLTNLTNVMFYKRCKVELITKQSAWIIINTALKYPDTTIKIKKLV